MKCERCQKDKAVHKYGVDGFTGYLCENVPKPGTKSLLGDFFQVK